MRVPGIAFAEWGPGDMALSHGYVDREDPSYAEASANARTRIKAACDAENIAFLDGVTPDNVAERIDSGVRIPSCGVRRCEYWAQTHQSHNALVEMRCETEVWS